MKKKVEKFILFRIIFPLFYNICALRPINKNKVLFIEVRGDKLDGSFRMIRSWLKNNKDNAEIQEVYLKTGRIQEINYLKNCMELLWKLANSRVVFISEACNVLGAIKKRKNTRIIQLWHGCGAFKKFGFSTTELLWGAEREELEKYPNYKNMDIVTVSSPEVIWAYEEAMGIEREKIHAVGISRTDIFFQKSFIRKCHEEFRNMFPHAADKKVILYAPTFRGSLEDAKTCEEFPYKAFTRKFGDRAILLVKHHPFVQKRPEIPAECADKVFDVTDNMEIEKLLCISDMCISDYSSLIFEYSLMEKPMIFFAPDIEEYNNWRGFYYSYEELTPGPVCKDQETLLAAVNENISHFDVEKVRAFRQKFMCACDGDATKRIMELAWKEDT